MQWGEEVIVTNDTPSYPWGSESILVMGNIDNGWLDMRANVIKWKLVRRICLPIDHPYYQQKETNMKPWRHKRVDEICTEYAGTKSYTDGQMAEAFAEYVGKHEEEPVDEIYEALKTVVELGRYDTKEQADLLRYELLARGLQLVKKS